MMKNKATISLLLALLMLLSCAAFGSLPAYAEEDQSDIDQQLRYISTQVSSLKQQEGENPWYYTVTDLDHDGSLEFVAASQHPQDRSTNLMVWEVGSDRSSLSACQLSKDEDESFPDILTDSADTFHDTESDTWFYLVYDNIVLPSSEVYTIKTAVNMKDGVLAYDPYAIEHTVMNGSGRSVSHTDVNGFSISAEEYNAAGNNAFQNAERFSTNFEWIEGENAEDLHTLTDSYAVFAGMRKATEVFPVPKDEVVETPEETVVPVEAPRPTPKPEPKYLVITKNPTNEYNRRVGGTANFVACGSYFTSLSWTLVSPDGGEYSAQQAGSLFPGLVVSGVESTTLSLANLSENMSGWGAYCTFYYEGQTARTSTGYISFAKDNSTPAPAQGGSASGTVYDWNFGTVSIRLDDGNTTSASWTVCSVSGDIYNGAPATIVWRDSISNVISCSIHGSEAVNQPVYASMSGTVSGIGNAYTLTLANGTSVTVSSSVCTLSSGEFVGEGDRCVVYYTDSPTQENIYKVEVQGQFNSVEIPFFQP